MTAMIGIEPRPKLEPENFMWVSRAGIRDPDAEPSVLPPRVCTRRKLELGSDSSGDVDILHSVVSVLRFPCRLSLEHHANNPDMGLGSNISFYSSFFSCTKISILSADTFKPYTVVTIFIKR